MSDTCPTSSIFPSSIPLFLNLMPPHPSAFSVVQSSNLLAQQQLHPRSPIPQQILHYSWTTPAITVTGALDAPADICEPTHSLSLPSPLDLTTMRTTSNEEMQVHTLTTSPEHIRRQSSSSSSSSPHVLMPRRKPLKDLDRSSAEYNERRRLKNEIARRTRDTRRWTQQAIDARVKALEEENACLRQAVLSIQAELTGLRQLQQSQQSAAQLLVPRAALS